MNNKLDKIRHFWKILAALFFVFCISSTSGATVSSAPSLGSTSATESPADAVRQHMLDIAYLYAHHRWQAITTNVIHPPYSFECENRLCEQDHITKKQIWNYANNWMGDLDESAMQIKIDTPMWISTDGGVYNEGIPYAWGLSSGVVATEYDKQVDSNIKNVFIPIGGTNRSFDELIDVNHRYFAGNQNYDTNNGNWWAAGVDCVGLINNAWQMGGRYDMYKTKEHALPIKFKDLKPGDILMSEGSHVMLFEKFDPPLNGEPVNGTIFWVYEAFGAPDWKVRYHPYTLANVPTTNSNNEEVVIIQGLNGPYTPRTYFPIIPIDIVLVIDKSGSMSGEQLERTKEAAIAFVGMMRTDDRLAVVAFNGEDPAQQVYPGSQGLGIINEAEKGFATAAISNIVAGGGTSIGAGLQQAVLDFESAPTSQSEPIRVAILFSDGYGSGYENVTQDLENAKIIVHTLAVGDKVSQDLMKRIADEHYGEYQWIKTPDRMRNALNTIRELIYGGNTVVNATPSQTIAAGGVDNENLLVDSAMGSMTITFFTSGSGINLTLTQPDGNPIDTNSPNVTYTSGSNYETYTILAPKTGTWITSVSSSVAGKYWLTTSTMDAMTFSVSPDKDSYLSGESIKITASVNDSTSGSLPAGPNYIHGATMQVTVENPALAQSTFDLYDDGQHDDGGADDGIYSNVFSATALGGSYNFNVQVSGNNNRDGMPFVREHRFFAVVDTTPPFVDSSRTAVQTPYTRILWTL